MELEMADVCLAVGTLAVRTSLPRRREKDKQLRVWTLGPRRRLRPFAGCAVASTDHHLNGGDSLFLL